MGNSAHRDRFSKKEEMLMRLVLQTANAAGVETNCIYPNRVEVTSAEELREAVKMDHVCGEYKDNYLEFLT